MSKVLDREVKRMERLAAKRGLCDYYTVKQSQRVDKLIYEEQKKKKEDEANGGVN